MSNLLTFEIVEQWYLCQANFLYPSLALLASPVYFLVVIQLFTILGAYICFRKRKMRLNSFILSLYPLCFHACFLIFYFSSDVQTLIIAETICFGVYLLGVFHHCFTVIYEIVIFIKNCWRVFKEKHQWNQITPMARLAISQALNKIKRKKKHLKNKTRENSKDSFESHRSEAINNTPRINIKKTMDTNKPSRFHLHMNEMTNSPRVKAQRVDE